MTASADWADFDWEFARDLFGRAQHQAAQAQRYAAITGPGQDRSVSASERRCVASAVASVAGAVEEWVTSALLATRVPLPGADPLTWHGALSRWRRLPAIAWSLGRTHDFALTPAQEASLVYLGAWHHALTYADPKAETWLHDRYVSLGEMDGRHNITRMISANLAGAVVTEAAGLFDWAHHVTGLPAPGSPYERDRQERRQNKHQPAAGASDGLIRQP